MNSLSIIFNKFLFKLFKVSDVRSALGPLLYCLNIFGMVDIDIKQHSLKCLRIFLMFSLYIWGCIMLFQHIEYAQMYKGHAIKILAFLFEIISGMLNVVVFYYSRIGKSNTFRRWYESFNKIDYCLNKIEIFIDYFKIAQIIFVQVFSCMIIFVITFTLCFINGYWNFNFIMTAGFVFPIVNQGLFYSEFFSAFLLILERLKLINRKLYRKDSKSDYIKNMVLLQEQLIDMSAIIVQLNGPVDIATRFINLVVTVFGVYNLAFAIIEHNETKSYIVLTVLGIICNQISAFTFLAIAQECSKEVCNKILFK